MTANSRRTTLSGQPAGVLAAAPPSVAAVSGRRPSGAAPDPRPLDGRNWAALGAQDVEAGAPRA